MCVKINLGPGKRSVLEVLLNIMLVGKLKNSFSLLALSGAVVKAYYTEVITTEHMLRFLARCKFDDLRTHHRGKNKND
jgi:hypothetical protein